MKKIIFALIFVLLALTCITFAFAHDENINVFSENNNADNDGFHLNPEKESFDVSYSDDWDFEWENIKHGGA